MLKQTPNSNSKLLQDIINCSREEMNSDKFDESHNFEHIQRVVHLSTQIMQNCEQVMSPQMQLKVIMCAYLHEILDSKYTTSRDLQYANILQKLVKIFTINIEEIIELYIIKKEEGINGIEEYVQNLLKMTEYVSFSKENKLTLSGSKFTDIFNEEDHFIRNIVSDADKIDAVGKIGLMRTIAYKYYKTYSAKNGNPKLLGNYLELGLENKNIYLTFTLIIADVKFHSNEKLFLLSKYTKFEYSKEIMEKGIRFLKLFLELEEYEVQYQIVREFYNLLNVC